MEGLKRHGMKKDPNCVFPGSDQWIRSVEDLVKRYEDYPMESLASTKHRLTFIQLTKKLMFSQRMSSNIVGTIKGKFILESELSPELSAMVGQQLGWEIPRKKGSPREVSSRSSAENLAEADNPLSYSSESDYDDDESSVDNPYGGFLERMDEIDEGEGIEEIAASGLLTGLKSWLNFGSSVVQNAMADTEQKKVYLMGILEPGEENNVIKSSKGPARMDDKLTRKAEERTNRITNDFCAWLRSLPLGEDDSINNTPEAQIKALFDTAQSANPNKSKLAEGLKFWAKFGEQTTGASLLRPSDSKANKWTSVSTKRVLKKSRAHRDLVHITSTQVAKRKFRKMYRIARRRRLCKLRQMEEQEEESDEDEFYEKAPFDHREYGAWYLKPSSWNERYVKKRDDDSGLNTLHHEIQKEKSDWANEDPIKNASLVKLESTKAFAEFIRKRKNNNNDDTPKFLRNILAKATLYN